MKAGTLMVLLVRLDALQAAIESRDWAAVEWEFDRTRRAATKHVGGPEAERELRRLGKPRMRDLADDVADVLLKARAR